MYIKSLTIKNFRCFGEDPTTIRFSKEITTLIGANGAGKTALLYALLRVFGITREQRTIKLSDFYVNTQNEPDNQNPKKLFIDVRLAFPELKKDDEIAQNLTIPACFQHMCVDEPGVPPFCRIRLEAQWIPNNTLEGAIEQKLYWVRTNEDDPDKEKMTPLTLHEFGLIQVQYVPATRDATSQLKYATNTMVGRLLKAIEWSKAFKDTIEKSTGEIHNTFKNEKGVKILNNVLNNHWKTLYEETMFSDPELCLTSRRFDEILRQITITFNDMERYNIFDELSEGQKSLFYFSLAGAVFEIEQDIMSSCQFVRKPEADSIVEDSSPAFCNNLLKTPFLTLFAVEEPENHLSPFYLSRIISQIRTLIKTGNAQSIVTSHSPAILGRVHPLEIRHFQMDFKNRKSIVKELEFPNSFLEPEEIVKYVLGAVRAYPELYFARFVILVEGDSERIVLPRLANAMGLNLDPSFVAIVPLGGRHVNYFWRLLSGLNIPYATLLDFDLGRKGAGWGRIKYAFKQLLEIGIDRDKLLTVLNGHVLTDEELESMNGWQHDRIDLYPGWITRLEQFNVFFSYPLDLDLSMLSVFLENYKSIETVQRGPNIPQENNLEYHNYMQNAGNEVLGKENMLPLYDMEELSPYMKIFPWYRYLFSTKSKPATHLYALKGIDSNDLKSNAPEPLKRLLNIADKAIKQ